MTNILWNANRFQALISVMLNRNSNDAVVTGEKIKKLQEVK